MYYWGNNSAIFLKIINLFDYINITNYFINEYYLFRIFLICTYFFVLAGIIVYIILLKDSFKKVTIKKSKIKLFILRNFIEKNIFIFYFMILGKHNLYNILLEINFDIIFCNNNNLIFHNKIKCYSANHIILFISSIIITIIEFFICFIGVSIIFSNEEEIMKGTVKHFISNPEKIIFIVKTIMLLILAIDKIIKMNKLMIPLFSFISGIIIFYSFFLEHYYHKSNDFRQLFNYSLSVIYFFSGLFIFIGYILKDKDKKGYFFFFCFILFNFSLSFEQLYL